MIYIHLLIIPQIIILFLNHYMVMVNTIKTNFGSLRLNNLEVYTHDTINYSDDDCSFNFITTDYNLTLNNGDYFLYLKVLIWVVLTDLVVILILIIE